MNLREMVTQLEWMGIKDERVLAAIAGVDRKLFVPKDLQYAAYEDRPLPIGYGQTISQPYTVARMIEILMNNEKCKMYNERVLEIGTGSGWQACILAHLYHKVYTVEIIAELSNKAKFLIRNLEKPHPPPLSSPQERGVLIRYKNIHFLIGDGKGGWRENAPFDAIICGANANEIPKAWKEQLKMGGRIVCPVRGTMKRVIKGLSNEAIKYDEESFGRYSFVPLV